MTITLGYAIGGIRIGSFTLSAVTGVLLARLLVGQLGILPPSRHQADFLFAVSVLDRIPDRSFSEA